MKVNLILLASLLVLAGWYGCDRVNTTAGSLQGSGDPESKAVIAKAIEAQGGERLEKHDIEFRFRDRTYKSIRDGGMFTYERIFIDTSGYLVRDVFTNESFTRYINGEVAEITDERKKAFSNSVNSVIYFALLPYFLRDPAVQSEYIGTSTIKGEPYHKIGVTFRQEGGGKDFEDEFIYWFHQDRFTMDYMAYNYQTDGGGSRFRKAYNTREIGGIRFADYVNYKHREETLYIMNFDTLFEAGQLDSLSLIETEDIIVR